MYTTPIVKMQLEAEKTGDWTKLKQRIDKNMLINLDVFHRIFCLKIGNPGKENVINAIRELEKREDILSAEPDYIGSKESLPDDTYYVTDSQWGLNGTYGINAPKAWSYSVGSLSILVGVIDTGIDGTHPDLTDNININFHRDYVDHPFWTTYRDVTKDDLYDPDGHGTHVAGIIGAKGNNTVGVCGVTWNVKLVSLRVIDEDGHIVDSDVERSIDYAEYCGISLLNFSARLNNDHNGTKTQIEQYSGLFVCSAGNNPQDNDYNNHYPSNYNFSNLIAVGAIYDTGYKRYSSNYGMTTVDLFAPGDNIASTYPIDLYDSSDSDHIAIGYCKMGGTSMATPFVTGVAALMLSINSSLTPQQIKYTIMNNVTRYSALTNLCVSGGRLDAFKAVSAVVFSASLVSNGIQISGFTIGYTPMNNMMLDVPDTFSLLSSNYGFPQSNVVSINSNAFYNKTTISSVILPDTITSIGFSVFENCTSLTNITLPNTITSIENDAFRGCTSLTSISLPNTVTSIGSSAFENCTSLTSVTLPNALSNIGNNTFKGCSSLSGINIPASVYSIGDSAFYNCTSLSSVTVNRDITDITTLGTNAFSGCTSLSSIIVPINREAEYKNKTNWALYKSIIDHKFSENYEVIEINCLSNNVGKEIILHPRERKLYKLDVKCSATYRVDVTGLVRTNLYDSDMTYRSTNYGTFYLNLNSGVDYYIDLEYDLQELVTATISFSAYNFDGNIITYGVNDINNHLHHYDNTFSKCKLKFNNTLGPGFYKFTLTGEKSDYTNMLYYDGAISLYNNQARTDAIDRLDITGYNYDSLTIQGENSMWVYLPRSGYFYIDINMPTDNYASLYLTISSPSIQDVDIFDLQSVTSYENINLLSNISDKSDYVKEIEIKQAGVFYLTVSYSGMQVNPIDLFLISKEDLTPIYLTTLSSNNTYRNTIFELEDGSYYLGYFNLNSGVITDIHLNRYVDNEMNEIFGTLITDIGPASCGSEINILESNITNKSYYGTFITVGFTRLIYIDSNSDYPLSRLYYYWYSSDEEVATVTQYGTVLGRSSGSVKILAVLKSDPSIIFEKDFTINTYNSTTNIIVNNNYYISYSDTNNGLFHLHLENINIPYPMYTYYSWATTNESSGLIVENDSWGNYTVNTYGSFTLTASNYIYNSRITIVINVVITNE